MRIGVGGKWFPLLESSRQRNHINTLNMWDCFFLPRTCDQSITPERSETQLTIQECYKLYKFAFPMWDVANVREGVGGNFSFLCRSFAIDLSHFSISFNFEHQVDISHTIRGLLSMVRLQPFSLC